MFGIVKTFLSHPADKNTATSRLTRSLTTTNSRRVSFFQSKSRCLGGAHKYKHPNLSPRQWCSSSSTVSLNDVSERSLSSVIHSYHDGSKTSSSTLTQKLLTGLAIAAAASTTAATSSTTTTNLENITMQQRENHKENAANEKKSEIMATSFATIDPLDSRSSYLQQHGETAAAKLGLTLSPSSSTTTDSSSESGRSTKGVNLLSKALAQRHERQKVALGRLLHEFHTLAEEIATATSSSNNSSTAEEEENKRYDDTPQHDSQNQCSMTHLQQMGGRKATSEDEMEEEERDYIRLDPKDEHDLIVHHTMSPDKAMDLIGQIRAGGMFRRDDLKKVTKAVSGLLLTDDTVIDLRGRKDLERITVVGDLHGHFNCLCDVLSLVGDGPKNAPTNKGTPWDQTGAVVFNGDFVDRGDNSLDVVLTLLLLKLAYPRHVFLNRGNHEDGILSTVYGYNDELKKRYKDSQIDDVWECFEQVFSALPLCVRTETAAIMHGGIPSDGFQLSELEAVTPEQRSKIKSTLEPGDDPICQLVQNVLWSDPRPEMGVHPNEDRGAGVHFGPDVLQRFLKEHGLNIFIRSHEPVDAGYEHLACSDEHSVVTVFSASSYPNGEGYNWGAVIRLLPDGSFEPVAFPGETHTKKSSEKTNEELNKKRTFAALAEVIAQNKRNLEGEFEAMADKNQHRQRLSQAFSSDKTKQEKDDEHSASISTMITREQWADCMAFVLDLPNIDWISLQPYLAPTNQLEQVLEKKNADNNNDTNAGMIDYRQFLEMHSNVISGSDNMKDVDPVTMDLLLENHSMLLTVFKFLDTDGNGLVDRTEFMEGMALLRKRFPENYLQDPEAIFDAIDIDGSGAIRLEEFEKAFQVVEMPYDIAVFKLFDTDRSGTIDRMEFREGVKLLNQRLPQQEQVKDADALFDIVDVNGDGEIELNELRTVLHDYFPSI